MRSFYLIILTLALSCSVNRDSESLSQKQKDYFFELGNQISIRAQQALGGQLKKALQEGGPSHAIQFCNMAAKPILDTVITSGGIELKRTSLKTRNGANKPTKMESALLTQFENLNTNNLKLEPVVQVLENGSVHYAAPILLNNPICLNCHGTKGTEIADQTYELIRELYPQDQATGYALDEVRGMWSITFSKEVVDQISIDR